MTRWRVISPPTRSAAPTSFEPTALWDDANLTFELAGAYVTSHDSSELVYDDHGTVINLRWNWPT